MVPYLVTLVAAGAFLGLRARAQAIPAILPTNWTSVGCFTDVSTSRTLAATSLIQDPMTIEMCISFCTSGNFIFAGLEFGRECYCDSTIQVPSTSAPATDCDMACSGNANELCGGPVRMNVFQSNMPPPIIPQTVTSNTGGLWTYEGCFTDTPAARTLGTGVNIPTGTTAESCTAACLAAGEFTFAGLENGHECWCDNSVNAPTQRVADSDCKMVCSATHAEFCGNADRVAVYQFSPSGKAPTQVCQQTSLSNFTLRAQFKNPPVSGPSTVPLKVVAVEMVQNVIWSVLSACTTCCSEWPALSLSNSIITPHSVVVATQQMTSTFTNDGESPNFVASVPAFPGSQAYCTMTDTTAIVGSPSILAFNGQANAFSLCTNTSANARVDLVFSPITGHAHYTLDSCQPVNVQVITS